MKRRDFITLLIGSASAEFLMAQHEPVSISGECHG
jgi:hypothetical protein